MTLNYNVNKWNYMSEHWESQGTSISWLRNALRLSLLDLRTNDLRYADRVFTEFDAVEEEFLRRCVDEERRRRAENVADLIVNDRQKNWRVFLDRLQNRLLDETEKKLIELLVWRNSMRLVQSEMMKKFVGSLDSYFWMDEKRFCRLLVLAQFSVSPSMLKLPIKIFVFIMYLLRWLKTLSTENPFASSKPSFFNSVNLTSFDGGEQSKAKEDCERRFVKVLKGAGWHVK